MTDEDDLKRRFSALREFDEAHVPAYDAIRNRDSRDRAEGDRSWLAGWRGRRAIYLYLAAFTALGLSRAVGNIRGAKIFEKRI